MEIIKSSKQVTIEQALSNDIPEPGDPEDAGIERD
jgi:hypothetical protein